MPAPESQPVWTDYPSRLVCRALDNVADRPLLPLRGPKQQMEQLAPCPTILLVFELRVPGKIIAFPALLEYAALFADKLSYSKHTP